MSTDEVWLPAPGWESFYEVSSEGRVRSLPRDFILESGSRYRRQGKIISQSTKRGNHRYKRVHLTANGVDRNVIVHRLVLAAFDREPLAHEQACHIDGDPTNNRYDNLRWGTAKDNYNDRVRHGTAASGSGNSRAVLHEDDVVAIRSSSEPLLVLAQRYGVKVPHIVNIRCRNAWNHVR